MLLIITIVIVIVLLCLTYACFNCGKQQRNVVKEEEEQVIEV